MWNNLYNLYSVWHVFIRSGKFSKFVRPNVWHAEKVFDISANVFQNRYGNRLIRLITKIGFRLLTDNRFQNFSDYTTLMMSEWDLLLNVTCNDISVIMNKLNQQSGSQRHRHFGWFFYVPVQVPTRGHRSPFFIRLFRENAPFSRLLCAVTYMTQISLNVTLNNQFTSHYRTSSKWSLWIVSLISKSIHSRFWRCTATLKYRKSITSWKYKCLLYFAVQFLYQELVVQLHRSL